jgi:hypothetical protein
MISVGGFILRDTGLIVQTLQYHLELEVSRVRGANSEASPHTLSSHF